MNATDLEVIVHSRLLDLRNLEHLVQSSHFKAAYAKTDIKIRQAVIMTFINSRNVCGLRAWVRKKLIDDIDSMSFIELRDLAAANQILNYSRMDKAELYAALKGEGNGPEDNRPEKPNVGELHSTVQ